MKWWLELVIGALALVGLWVTLDKLSAGILRVWAWLRRDRVSPLLEDDKPGEPELSHEWHDHAPLGYHDEAVRGCPACEARWELPPERTWEQMTSHKSPVVGMSPAERKHWQKLERGRKRRAGAAERQHRAAYEACGFDYPSGLMARVREAAQ